MALRISVLFLFSFLAFSQTPRMRYIEYVGDGGDFEREIDTQIDQTISMVCVAPLIGSIPNLTHPDFFYVRIAELDTVSGTHGSGADKDSVCFFNAAGSGGGESGITPKGIKRWVGDTVIVGEYLNMLDTTYAMWVVSDPSDSFLTTGFYYGDGTDPRTITTEATDSLYGLMVLPGTQNASQAHFAMWSIGTANCQYFGERGADIGTVTNNSFNVSEGILAKMNTASEWYGYFGVMKDAKFVQTYYYTGNAAANSADTLTTDRAGFIPFMIWGLGFVGGSVTAGITGSGAMDAPSAITWRHTSTGGADYDSPPTSALVKVKADTIIVNNSDDLDLNGVEIKIFAFGDTAFYTPTGGTTPTIRQPCQGGTTKESNYREDKYIQ